MSMRRTQGNAIWSDLPPAKLDLEIRVDGITYRCTRGGPALDHDGPRILESGRFVQRADVTGLVFQSPDGQTLGAQSRFRRVPGPITSHYCWMPIRPCVRYRRPTHSVGSAEATGSMARIISTFL